MTTSAALEEPPSIRIDTRLFTRPFLILLGVQLSFGFAFSVFFLLPKYLTVKLHANPDAIGTVTAGAVFAAVGAVPFIGQLIDQRSRRPLILLGTVVTALASIAFIALDHVGPAMYAVRFVQGAAFSLVFNAAATLVTDLAPPSRMGQALGIFGAAGLSMNAFAPAISEAIAEHHGWGPVFMLSGIAALLAGGLSFLITERKREPTRPHSAQASLTSALRSGLSHAFANGRARMFYVCGVSGAAFGAVFTFVGPFALDLGSRRVALFFVGYTCAALLVRVLLGSAADRHGRRKVALFSLSIYGLVVLALSLLTPNLLFFFGACFGIAHGMFYPALNAMAIQATDPERRGTVMAYFSGAFYGGYTLSVVPCGLLATHLGFRAVFVATGLLTLSAVYSLAKVSASDESSQLKSR